MVAKCSKCNHIYPEGEEHKCPSHAYLTARDALINMACEAERVYHSNGYDVDDLEREVKRDRERAAEQRNRKDENA